MVGVVHAGGVDSIPVEHTQGCPSVIVEHQLDNVPVSVVFILGTLLSRVGVIGGGAPVYIGLLRDHTS